MSPKKSNNYASARKNELAMNSALSKLSYSPHSWVHETEEPIKLNPQLPDPQKGFTPLSRYSVNVLTKLVLKYISRLLQANGATVDTAYWGLITEDIFGARTRDKAMVIPARAGAGKSTWTTAFILALCELNLEQDPLAGSLGGVMIVLQKVQTLNEILDTIESFFPGHSEELMVALQGWSKSGQDHGFCPNQHTGSYRDCRKERCPYASTCKVIRFLDGVESGFIVGMTQARFSMLRRADELTPFLYRLATEHETSIPRRFLIFDEKYDMAQQSILSVPQVNDASTEVERIVTSLKFPDAESRKLQDMLHYRILKPLQEIRKNCEFIDASMDEFPFGFCSLRGEQLQDSLLELPKIFKGRREGLLNPKYQNCFEVMQRLFEEPCLFVKSGGFRVFSTQAPEVLFGSAQTIIFDATAEVDGDYLHLDQAKFLPSSPALHMDRVTFHIFQHPDLNVSKSALEKPWKLPAFSSLIESLIDHWDGDTFLCTYKEFAEFLPDQFSETVNARIPKMPNKDYPCFPYFGGTNGANNFNHCTNAIMLGYPRLSPGDYLQKAYAAWGDSGFADEIRSVTKQIKCKKKVRKNAFRELSMLREYESMHLAARLEQEIYRCALRNSVCNHDINIALFCPSTQLLSILLKRFDGCSVKYYDSLPDCVAFHRDKSRTYGGNPTAHNKLARFFEEWDGTPIKSSDLREHLGISDSAWKELMKSDRTKQLLKDFDVTRTGRGPNTTFLQQKKLCA